MFDPRLGDLIAMAVTGIRFSETRFRSRVIRSILLGVSGK